MVGSEGGASRRRVGVAPDRAGSSARGHTRALASATRRNLGATLEVVRDWVWAQPRGALDEGLELLRAVLELVDHEDDDVSDLLGSLVQALMVTHRVRLPQATLAGLAEWLESTDLEGSCANQVLRTLEVLRYSRSRARPYRPSLVRWLSVSRIAVSAAYALADVGGGRLDARHEVEALVELLDHPAEAVRYAVPIAARAYHHEDEQTVLRAAARCADPAVRSFAKEALGMDTRSPIPS